MTHEAKAKAMTRKAKAKDLTCHAALKPHFTLFNVNTSKPRKQYLKLSMVVSLSLVYYSDVLVTLKHHEIRQHSAHSKLLHSMCKCPW